MIIHSILLISLLLPQVCFALSWDDLWLRRDQQASHALAQGKPDLAAQLFTDPQWLAVAHYRSGQYQQTLEDLAAFSTADAYYNRGNALAHLGQYHAAITEYDQALVRDPKHEDAKHNRELLKKLLQQQQPSPQNNSQNQKQSEQKTAARQQNPQPKTENSSQKNPNQIPQNVSQAIPQPTSQQQWLQRIPDDPGGLLHQKFLRDHYRATREK